MSGTDRPQPPLPQQQQSWPGSTNKMQLRPDHGEESYKGFGRLAGKKAIITGYAVNSMTEHPDQSIRALACMA